MYAGNDLYKTEAAKPVRVEQFARLLVCLLVSGGGGAFCKLQFSCGVPQRNVAVAPVMTHSCILREFVDTAEALLCSSSLKLQKRSYAA